MNGEIEVLTIQLVLPPNKVVSVEDDTSVDPEDGDNDPQGVEVTFGVQSAMGDLTIFLPDETADRLLLALLENAPRISARTLARASALLQRDTAAAMEEYRERLDPGPLPLPAGVDLQRGLCGEAKVAVRHLAGLAGVAPSAQTVAEVAYEDDRCPHCGADDPEIVDETGTCGECGLTIPPLVSSEGAPTYADLVGELKMFADSRNWRERYLPSGGVDIVEYAWTLQVNPGLSARALLSRLPQQEGTDRERGTKVVDVRGGRRRERSAALGSGII